MDNGCLDKLVIIVVNGVLDKLDFVDVVGFFFGYYFFVVII